MWGLKFLNGPLAGQIIPLKSGSNKLGRAPNCELQLVVPGVSKVHLELMVTADRVLLNDMKSSNGTFLNGARIKGGMVKAGDKISVHTILMELVPFQGSKAMSVVRQQPVRAQAPVPVAARPAPVNYDPAAYGQTYAGYEAPAPVPDSQQQLQGKVQNAIGQSQSFVENVVLPGVYRLPQIFDFKSVVMGFIGIYIILVTLLSVVPMKQITGESIQNESLRRALTVARSLASANERLIRSSDLSSFSTDMVIREEGIVDVYIVSRDGTIMAPPERTGAAPREVGFVRKIRGQPREFSEQISDEQIAAAVPVLILDPELQQNVAKAHAVVLYNPGSLAFDDGRAFSSFVQMLFLAFVIGTLLFFFLYKLIEHPFKLLNSELDVALREGRDQAQILFNWPVLQNTLTNINSLLARAAQGPSSNQPAAGQRGGRDSEIHNLMQLMGYPCILITSEFQIARLNNAFESLTGMASERIVGQKINEIPDTAMQQNFLHLINQSQLNVREIITDSLELSGHQFTLNCQAISGISGDIEYYLISISPSQAAEGGAA